MNLSGKCIAIIDDNDSILMLFSAILEAHAATVYTAGSGRKFLNQAAELSADLILLDIQMPDLDGYQILKQLKSNPEIKRVPVIALTAHAMSGDKDVILQAGFNGYIAKPIDTRTFPELIASFLPT